LAQEREAGGAQASRSLSFRFWHDSKADGESAT
jgi:hypothetical protein